MENVIEYKGESTTNLVMTRMSYSVIVYCHKDYAVGNIELQRDLAPAPRTPGQLQLINASVGAWQRGGCEKYDLVFKYNNKT